VGKQKLKPNNQLNYLAPHRCGRRVDVELMTYRE